MKKLLCALGLLLIPGVLFAQAPIAADAISASSTDCTVASSCVLLRFPPGTASVGVQIAGTFSETLLFEATLDGVNFTAVGGTPIAGGAIVTSATAAGVWQFGVAGLQELRVRCSVFASGQASVVILGTQGMPGAATAIASFTAVGNKVEVVDGSGNILPTTPSGSQTAANSDSIVCATDTTCITTSVAATSGSGVVTYAATGTAAATIDASPGQIYGIAVDSGANTADVWVELFNAASGSVTLGSTPVMFSFKVPGGTAPTGGGNNPMPFGVPIGIPFSTALSWACTTGPGGATQAPVYCGINVVRK
jgi:hypothetical protein